MANLNKKARLSNDILVRNAIPFAKNPAVIDKAVTKGLYPDNKNVSTQGTPFCDNPAELYCYDPAKARSLIEEAGYKKILTPTAPATKAAEFLKCFTTPSRIPKLN